MSSESTAEFMAEHPVLASVVERLLSPDIERVLLATHVHMDGDGLGAAVSIRRALELCGKKARIATLERVPQRYRMLPGTDAVIRLDEAGVRADPPVDVTDCDLLVVTDCGEPKLLGGLPDIVDDLAGAHVPILNVDHHVSNLGFGDLSCVLTDVSSTAEVAYHLVHALGVEFDQEIAMGVYVGLVLDTGSFSLPNTSPSAHRLAAEMLEYDLQPSAIAQQMFHTKRLAYMRVSGAFQRQLRISSCGRVAWGKVSLELCQAAGVEDHELDDLIDAPRMLEGVSVAMVMREIDGGGGTRISLRSRGRVDVNAFLQQHGGGGHREAAGCVLPHALDEVEAEFVPRLLELCEAAGIPHRDMSGHRTNGDED